MTPEQLPTVVAEARETEVDLAGLVPRYELESWRDRWGVVAGVTGRGFDLGLWTREPVGEVVGRWRAFRRGIPGFHATVMAHQVHGADVLWHADASGWVLHEGADGHGTAARGVLLAVTIADCIPVYVWAPDTGAVALLHAGWRGTAGGILGRGVALLAERTGADPAAMVVHAGVGICGPCYEVGAEVVTGVGLAADGRGPWHVDLRARLAAEAERLGIREVTVSTWCSAHDRGRFYSHRASGGADGRMVAYLGVPEGPGDEA